jgi:outer membrane lipoprotein-sorting protein
MRHWMMGTAVALLAASICAADDKAEDVVKKAIDAHGGADALNKYKGGRFQMKGELPIMGKDTEFTADAAYAVPGKAKINIYLEVMGMKVTVSQVMNGDKFKRTVKVGDMTVPAGEEDKEEIKVNAAMQEVERLVTLLDAKRFTIKAGGEEDVNGKKAAVVVVTPKSVDKDIKLYFDKTSGMLVKASHRGAVQGEDGASSEKLQERYPTDYKKVNGVQIPMKIEVHHDGKKFMTATVSDYELLEKIDDSEFKIDN